MNEEGDKKGVQKILDSTEELSKENPLRRETVQ